MPGLIICFIVMLVGIYAANLVGLLLVNINLLPEGSASPVSGIFVAILIGILIRNTIGLHPVFMEGVTVSVKYALRAGIILLGLRLKSYRSIKAWCLGAAADYCVYIMWINCHALFHEKAESIESIGHANCLWNRHMRGDCDYGYCTRCQSEG